MANDLRKTAESCEVCLRWKPANKKESLQQHDIGDAPWQKIAIDLFEIQKRQYLVTVDYYSNFIEVDYLAVTSTKQIVTKLKSHFSRYGTPRQLMSDQGPQFKSQEFKQFMTEWGINHVMSSPYHHQSNGKAEAAVKIIKTMMKKTNENQEDQNIALLELRNTPRQDTGLSPAKMMFGRETRSIVPSIRKEKRKDKFAQKRQQHRKSVKRYYDKTAKDLAAIPTGTSVFYKKEDNAKQWRKGIVQEQIDRSYLIGDGNGLYERNRVHIRPGVVEPTVPESTPETNTHSEVVQTDGPTITEDVNENVQTPSRPQRDKRPPVWMNDYQ